MILFIVFLKFSIYINPCILLLKDIFEQSLF